LNHQNIPSFGIIKIYLVFQLPTKYLLLQSAKNDQIRLILKKKYGQFFAKKNNTVNSLQKTKKIRLIFRKKKNLKKKFFAKNDQIRSILCLQFY